MTAIVGAIASLLAAGLVNAFVRSTPRRAACANAALVALAAAACLPPAVRTLADGRVSAWSAPWEVPGGALALGLDPLSAFFLIPVALLSIVCAAYGVAYLEHADARRARLVWSCFDALVAGMLLVLVARNAVLFLVAWELMSLAAWALVAFGRRGPDSARAGWVYLLAAHVGSGALLLLLATLAEAAGGPFDLAAPPPGGLDGAPAAALLALGLLGFGVKAGVVPLHVWLPEAHAAAPSHVSALMSGAMVKLGLYGLLRLATLVGPLPPAAGLVLAGLGLAGALLGIALSLQQRDLKRALAYSSVENLGLVALGLGLAAWGGARGEPALALLGLLAALLHVWNHAAMKGLLFLAAGGVLHASGTRDLERLGGVLRRMPVTGVGFALGAVAISGLPPLNGFASEWLLYRGLLGWGLESPGAAGLASFLAVALLALVGGLAAASFVRLFGIAFLGEPRSDEAAQAREGGPLLWGPLLVLSGGCIALGVLPAAVARLAGSVAQQVLGSGLASRERLEGATAALAPIGELAAATWIALALGAGLVAVLLRGRSSARDATWGCGHAAVGPRMQYTARSFSELLCERVLPRALAPRVAIPAPRGVLPAPVQLASEEGDPLTRGVYQPLFGTLAGGFSRLRALQQGNAHLYLTYVLVAVLVALAWTSLRGRWLP